VETDEALAIGMIDRVAAPEALLAEAHDWAKELTIGSATAIALTKEIIDKTFERSDDEIFALGREAQAVCYTTAEHRKSVEDFLNKQSK
jgi:enoyl-CoA hydratase/carnithine racemase